MQAQWVTARQIAKASGIPERTIRYGLRLASQGEPWRDCKVSVKVVCSNRGRGGVSYLAEASSLPPSIASSLTQLTVHSLQPNQASTELDTNRVEMVRAVMEAGPPKSPGRTQAIRELSARVGVHSETLRKWVARLESQGYIGLAKKARADRGKRRVQVNRAFDRAARAEGLDDAALERIKADLVRYVRSLNASSEAPTSINGQFAGTKLKELAERELGRAPGDQLEAVCRVSRRDLDEARRWRIVAQVRLDAKKTSSDLTPRVTRSRALLAPGDVLLADCTHLDVWVRRDDGELCTPKLVLLVDAATCRIFWRLFLKAKGAGITRRDVLETFAAAVVDPLWGIPRRILVDRGGEFNFDEIANDICRLSGPLSPLEKAPYLGPGTKGDRVGLQRALPYSGQSKALVEGAFSHLTRGILRGLPGFAGSDRLKAKTANAGQAPTPHPGGFVGLHADFANGIRTLNATPKGGQLAGLSPDQALQRAIDGGWRAMVLDREAIDWAFSDVIGLKVSRQGRIKHQGKTYYSDMLTTLSGTGVKTYCRVPLTGDRDRLIICDPSGQEFKDFVLADQPYLWGDPAGAAEAGRRKAAFRAEVRKLADQTERLDMSEQLARHASSLPPPPVAPEPDRAWLTDAQAQAAEAGRALATPTNTGESDEIRRTRERLSVWLDQIPPRPSSQVE